MDQNIKPRYPDQPGDKNCDEAQREHAWHWIWEDTTGVWTDEARCAHCGMTTTMKRPADAPPYRPV